MRKYVLMLLIVIAMLGLSACQTTISYTLYFDSCGGSNVENITTDGKSIIQIPENPTKDDYVFDGWYWDKDVWEQPLTANSLLDAPISSNMTVYAKWKPETETPSIKEYFSVTFVFEYGTLVEGVLEQTIEKGLSAVAPVIIRNGYILSWDKAFNDITADTTVTAIWTKKSFSVTFSGNGGVYVSGQAVQSVLFEETAVAPIFTKKGYSLSWDKDFDCITDDLSVIAVWTANTYTIILNSTGGSTVNETEKVEFDSAYTLEIPTRTGYDFVGWFDRNNEDGVKYTDNEGVSLGSWQDDTENKTLYARWTAKTIQITINWDYDDMTFIRERTYGESYPVTSSPSRNGYTFKGYYTERNGNGEKISDNAGNVQEWIWLDLTEIFAYWTPNKYILTLNPNDGSSTSTIEVEYDTFFDVPVPQERQGYVFNGWAYSSNFYTDDLGNGIKKWDNHYDRTLTARWTAIFSFSQGTGTINGLTDYGKTLEHITVPSKIDNVVISTIGQSAFKYSDMLKSIVIPNSVTTFGNASESYAIFEGCNSLERITLPFVGYKANEQKYSNFGYLFGTTQYINSIAVTQYTYAWHSDYNGNKTYYLPQTLTSVTITDSTTIKDYAFENCSSLTEIILPTDITSVERYAFSGCVGLVEIVIPEGVQSIGAYAFSGCVGLTSVVVPNSVESIGDSAFSGCSGLKTIQLPFVGRSENATDYEALFGYIFGKSAYDGGTLTSQTPSNFNGTYYLPVALKKVIIIGGELPFGSLRNCDKIESVIIGQDVTNINYGAFIGCTSLKEINVHIDNQAYKSIEGILFDKTGTNLLRYPEGKNGKYVVPPNVTAIGYYAFYGCSELTSVEIYANVEVIEGYAFWGCSKLTILVEMESPLLEWDSFWNILNHDNSSGYTYYVSVIWGYIAE